MPLRHSPPLASLRFWATSQPFPPAPQRLTFLGLGWPVGTNRPPLSISKTTSGSGSTLRADLHPAALRLKRISQSFHGRTVLEQERPRGRRSWEHPAPCGGRDSTRLPCLCSGWRGSGSGVLGLPGASVHQMRKQDQREIDPFWALAFPRGPQPSNAGQVREPAGTQDPTPAPLLRNARSVRSGDCTLTSGSPFPPISIALRGSRVPADASLTTRPECVDTNE